MSLNIKTISAIKREKYSIVIKSTDIPPSFSFRWGGTHLDSIFIGNSIFVDMYRFSPTV